MVRSRDATLYEPEDDVKNRWYVPKNGWDYFIVLGVLINVIVSALLIIAYVLD